MIHKKWQANGNPDLREWTVECNRCHVTHPLMDSEPWLIPIDEEMDDYCPACVDATAQRLIESAATSRTRGFLNLLKAFRRDR